MRGSRSAGKSKTGRIENRCKQRTQGVDRITYRTWNGLWIPAALFD